jgi:hypothetical protein
MEKWYSPSIRDMRVFRNAVCMLRRSYLFGPPRQQAYIPSPGIALADIDDRQELIPRYPECTQ